MRATRRNRYRSKWIHKKQHHHSGSAVREQEALLPAEGLTQNPERRRNRNKEQAKTNGATPAEPRSPRAPVLHTVFVAPALLVLGTFALVLHSVPLLVDESLSPRRFDYTL